MVSYEEILAMPMEEFETHFPGCVKWLARPKLKVGEVVIGVSHFGEPRTKVYRVSHHLPPSQINPRGWTVVVDGVDVPGYENGGFSTGWEGYFEPLDVYELERAWRLTEGAMELKMHDQYQGEPFYPDAARKALARHERLITVLVGVVCVQAVALVWLLARAA